MVTKIILQTLESITKQLSLFLRACYAAGTVLKALYTFSHFDSDNFVIPILILIIVVLSLGHIITIILQMRKLRWRVVSTLLNGRQPRSVRAVWELRSDPSKAPGPAPPITPSFFHALHLYQNFMRPLWSSSTLTEELLF